MRPSLDEVVKRKKQTHSVEASAMVFTQQGKPSERGVSKMDKKTITEALKHCANETSNPCIKCPYNKGSAQCISDLMRDALKLIGVLETNGEE